MNYKNKQKNNIGFIHTPNKKTTLKLVSGFTLIEVLVACSIISISTFALMNGAQKGIILSNEALSKSQASLLLEEGAEAVKSIRDDNWTTISNLNLNTPYYLSFNINTKKWELSNTNIPIDDVFSRSVIIESVERDSNDDIVSSSGTIDTGTKKVTISVSWSSSGVVKNKTLSFYIANIFN